MEEPRLTTATRGSRVSSLWENKAATLTAAPDAEKQIREYLSEPGRLLPGKYLQYWFQPVSVSDGLQQRIYVNHMKYEISVPVLQLRISYSGCCKNNHIGFNFDRLGSNKCIGSFYNQFSVSFINS